jgi:hypothetical protein
MSTARITWDGFDDLYRRIGELADPDAAPLMEEWTKVLVEGNRKGVLAGLDGNDVPMPPLTYRGGEGFAEAKSRRGWPFGLKRDYRTGWEKRIPGLQNSTTSEYKKMTGPRLAPQYARSRVIQNLEPGYGRDASQDYVWFAEAVWFDVVSEKGYHFLPVHFDGLRAGRGAGFTMPQYDLRPVRPADRELAKAEMIAWAKDLVRSACRG